MGFARDVVLDTDSSLLEQSQLVGPAMATINWVFPSGLWTAASISS